MSGRGLFRAQAKLPIPEYAVPLKKRGESGWGKKWLHSLGTLIPGESSRLARGRTYAREARVHDLIVNRGHIAAKVTGTQRLPYSVMIQLVPLEPSTWSNLIALMATKARFMTELLAGRMPIAVEDVVRIIEENLFPKRMSDIFATCSCPEWWNTCKHVAATHYLLAELLDDDPFILFELRGRTKSELLAALRLQRTAATPEGDRYAASLNEEIETVTLASLAGKNWNALRCDLPAMRFSFENPVRPADAVWQLGRLEAWTEEAAIGAVFEPQISAAAESARKMCMVTSAE